MPKLSRRVLLTGIALCLSGPAYAQSWPQRPVSVVVPQAAGNSPDVLCRIIADKLSRALGQQFVVENRPGAANLVGTQAVARAAPDGYTFLFATSAALVTNPYTFKKLPYDPMKDFVPVAMVARSNHVLLVNPEVKAKTLAELIALEKSAPGSLSMAVDGPRNLSGLIAQSINKQAGTGFVLVPYNTTTNAVQDSMTGRVQVTIQAASIAESFIAAGTLRPVAVAGSKRIGSLPDVPAIAETLKSVDLQGWFMLMAPAGTPTDIIQKLSSEIAGALKSPEVQERAPALGFDVGIGDAVTPAGAKRFLDAEHASAGKVIQELGIQPE
ncbi:tripartite tricarboxylate transporter substrate binding protein [Bradyrhizobium sp. AUGA SZCCT0177]|uniref:Bug family tripartite tricarboxylate transporter substrate binding protein n=1 Tax=unclassified Bradyrhizobium TaxID=2631580 RepID=UPI001BAD66D3|nr:MULTISPECIES: tripartite tricarboxylate transporter substrate binding protein [unclassified Bradyrhizobium]MBR1236508.1 tripartite tricarboxylate transporter substrate binding protein [Bradyrhizobium sp. AUGA SZCCT0182]MBR1285435.1 tripartite tricarboxylate transporter substrate binding protein [Bradyrhizobium sp. AUGA SZCCT0177]